MKKHLFRNLLAAVLGVILCFGLFCACNGNGGGGGTAFAIEDMSVTYQERATIVPKSAPDGDITYTFEGDNIRIQGNIVTGMKGNTETEVTATAANGATTTFKVSVVFANPFGKNANTQEGDGVFTPVDETTFRKTSAEYGEDYYYAGDNPLTGAAYLFTGKLMLGSEEEVPAEGAYAAIILKESAEKTVRFRFQSMGEGEYAVYSEYAEGDAFTGSEEIYSINENELGFAVMVKDGSAYFYCNQAYVGKVDKAFSNAHVGIGGEKADVTASSLRSYTDETDEGRMEEYLALTKVVFGAHAYGTANNNNIFSPTSNPGEYQKTSQSYGQTFYYQDGIPVAGNAYSIKFTVKVTNPAKSGLIQSTFMILKDDNNMIRFALEYRPSKKEWYMLTDQKIDGKFDNWQDLGTITGDTATFKIVYNNGTCSLYQCNGESEKLVKTVTLKNLGQTHFGFGGEKCTITLSDITAKRGA